jgi:hypothetical protein
MDRLDLSKDDADSIPLADEGRATQPLVRTVASLWYVIDDERWARDAGSGTPSAGARDAD